MVDDVATDYAVLPLTASDAVCYGLKQAVSISGSSQDFNHYTLSGHTADYSFHLLAYTMFNRMNELITNKCQVHSVADDGFTSCVSAAELKRL